MNKKIIAVFIIAVVILIAFGKRLIGPTASNATRVAYMCNDNKTIDAVFHKGEVIQGQAGQPPKLTGKVDLTLSDGRSMTLGQTISADGVRYANADESFVFWSKAEGALVLENNQEKSYIGCLVVKKTSDVTQVYHNGTEGIQFFYPSGYVLDTHHAYMLSNKTITGVKVTIPESVATGTNLGSDTYVSVEQIPRSSACSADMFLEDRVKTSTTTDNGTEYSFASSTGAGAGNRYEERVYALPGTNPCVAVRYFIHYGVYENYPEGSIKRFDENALIATFDAIRRSLTVNQ